MELLLHHTWRQRMFPLGDLRTTCGKRLEIIDPGLHNHDAGPDFFNAKIKVEGQLWVGNVELHRRSSDWYRHRHEQDERYNNVVLHVVEQADCEVTTQGGQQLLQWELQVPQELASRFEQLTREAHYPPCHSLIGDLAALHVHAWLSALATERLEHKTLRVEEWLERTAGDWEQTLFIALARAFGFGKNADAFEWWASSLDPQHTSKHRDNLFQIEAFFLGQAGLLHESCVPPERRDAHFLALQGEFAFLQNKFQLQPMAPSAWKFLRLRPQNFPYRRLAQLAWLYCAQQLNLSRLRQAETIEDLRQLLRTETPDYWVRHYTFGEVMKSDKHEGWEEPRKENKRQKHTISSSSIDLLIINAVAPVLFAYGRAHQDAKLCQRTHEWLEQLKPERNHITQAWQEVGITAQHAADSQALIHLRTLYCDRKECLRCRFGLHYLQSPR